jgi:hypothetical protein
VVFGGPSDLGIWIILANFLRMFVQHNRRASLRNEEEVDSLNNHTEDELDPEVPSPVEKLLDRTSADTTND